MVNVKSVQLGKTDPYSFARIGEVLEMPNLIEVQKNSYHWFLEEGLKEVFSDVSAITDYTGNLVFDFVDYRLDEKPKYTVRSARSGTSPTPPRCGSAPACSTRRPARSRSRKSSWAISR